jgi:hypothetical protein
VTTTHKDSGPGTAVLLTAGLFALGQAIQINRGAFDPVAIAWLSFAVLAALVTGLSPRLPWLDARAESAIVVIAGLGFAYQMTQLFTTLPGDIAQPPPDVLAPFHRALAVAAVVGGAGFAKQPRFGKLQPLLLVAPYLYAATWMIRVHPQPFIDVYVFQRGAVDALFAGQNPWAIRYPTSTDRTRPSTAKVCRSMASFSSAFPTRRSACSSRPSARSSRTTRAMPPSPASVSQGF